MIPILRIKDADGNIKDIAAIRGARGSDGKDGLSITIESISESDDDGGKNVVTFSDGKTLVIKNGSQGGTASDGENGADGVSCTHSWNGTVLTVTSASGTSSADLKGDKGNPGENGESVTVSSVSTSSEDGGSNIVTFSDGKTLTVKNGSKGTNGADGSNGISCIHSWSGTTLSVTSASGTSSADLKGEKGDSGATPVKGTDYFTDEDKAEMIDLVLAALPEWKGGGRY